jgi:hypothetical protein
MRVTQKLGIMDAAVYGAVGGLAAAGCMTALRGVAQRLGLIEMTAPQATVEWLQESGAPASGRPAKQLGAELLHLGMAAAWGAAFGVLRFRVRPVGTTGSLIFGLVEWALDFGVLAPRLRITASPARAGLAANLVNVAAHFVHGVVTATVADELARRHGRGSKAILSSERERLPTG